MKEWIEVLHEGRRRERAQAMFYRVLAGDAELAGDVPAAERLNELLADEQHHVSRLTARLLEVGEKPEDVGPPPEIISGIDAWEPEARRREADEVAWYEAAMERVSDPETHSILAEILVSERHHHAQLGGKWMSAARNDHEEKE